MMNAQEAKALTDSTLSSRISDRLNTYLALLNEAIKERARQGFYAIEFSHPVNNSEDDHVLFNHLVEHLRHLGFEDVSAGLTGEYHTHTRRIDVRFSWGDIKRGL